MGQLNEKVNPTFWNGKKVFLTGHTGFKGGWLTIWLNSMGAIVKGYALEAPTTPSLFNITKLSQKIDSHIGDIRDFNKLHDSMRSFNPDILIHMAAQPLVRLSYKEPISTYETNVMGTVNVLEAARSCTRLKAIVSVTTDKCYENREWPWGYRENEPMGGHDPYSSSKGCAELVTSAYRRSFFSSMGSPSLASARAGNVIGGGDWAEDRLIPDILRSFSNEDEVIIRNPKSIRPWQHVLEPLSGYLMLAERLYEAENTKFSDGWNFGPNDDDCREVSWILDKMVKLWGDNAKWKHDESQQPHEAGYLKLDCSKAKSVLGWQPVWKLEHSLSLIIDWHKAWKAGENMYEICIKEIKDYSK